MFEHVQSVNLRQKALFDAGQKKQEAAGPIVNWKQREEGLATTELVLGKDREGKEAQPNLKHIRIHLSWEN